MAIKFSAKLWVGLSIPFQKKYSEVSAPDAPHEISMCYEWCLIQISILCVSVCDCE